MGSKLAEIIHLSSGHRSSLSKRFMCFIYANVFWFAFVLDESSLADKLAKDSEVQKASITHVRKSGR